jgi:hypothetical protein
VSIAESVTRASAYLTEHPEEARYRDSSARARIESGLVVTVSGPAGERLRTDMPLGIGWHGNRAIARLVSPGRRGVVRGIPDRDPGGSHQRDPRSRGGGGRQRI